MDGHRAPGLDERQGRREACQAGADDVNGWKFFASFFPKRSAFCSFLKNRTKKLWLTFKPS
jgi:hypothetical protein